MNFCVGDKWIKQKKKIFLSFEINIGVLWSQKKEEISIVYTKTAPVVLSGIGCVELEGVCSTVSFESFDCCGLAAEPLLLSERK